MRLLQDFFAWMPWPFEIICGGVIVIFLLWVITGITKRVLELIPFR